jgi:hypothetical protein
VPANLGSALPGAGNIIAQNIGAGVSVGSGSNGIDTVSIHGNSIYGNSGLGIDLGGVSFQDILKHQRGGVDESKINSLIAAHCDMARPLAERKNIDLDFAASANLPPLRQDPAKVQQILNNLLSNAIKFSPAGATNSPSGCNGTALGSPAYRTLSPVASMNKAAGCPR